MKDLKKIITTILIVDDEPNNLQVLKEILQLNYTLIFAKNGERAIQLAKEQQPDLILLDIMMPEMDGYQVCETLKSLPETKNIPVIFVTAMSDIEDESQGFRVGAVDYITKPVSPAIVRARVKTHLSLVSMDKIVETRLEIIRRLGRAAEYKDNETGLHVIRMSHYCQALSDAIGLSKEQGELILNASPMHDIGKIGIPDDILLKPGPLDPKEWKIMQTHTTIGAQIIGDHDSRLLELAKRIAVGHHERWDGKGYPNGIGGTDIPLPCRIVTVCDVFDALTTQRPYKKAWPVEEAISFIRKNKGTMFEPALIDAFLDIMPKILELRSRWPEVHQNSATA